MFWHEERHAGALQSKRSKSSFAACNRSYHVVITSLTQTHTEWLVRHSPKLPSVLAEALSDRTLPMLWEVGVGTGVDCLLEAALDPVGVVDGCGSRLSDNLS